MAKHHIQALDFVSEGRWDEAHRLIQSYSDRNACLVHAYLHREEGDLGNANYWYHRADSEMPDNTLEEEFQRLCSLINED